MDKQAEETTVEEVVANSSIDLGTKRSFFFLLHSLKSKLSPAKLYKISKSSSKSSSRSKISPQKRVLTAINADRAGFILIF
jgi:hypothetical protein